MADLHWSPGKRRFPEEAARKAPAGALGEQRPRLLGKRDLGGAVLAWASGEKLQAEASSVRIQVLQRSRVRKNHLGRKNRREGRG